MRCARGRSVPRLLLCKSAIEREKTGGEGKAVGTALGVMGDKLTIVTAIFVFIVHGCHGEMLTGKG